MKNILWIEDFAKCRSARTNNASKDKSKKNKSEKYLKIFDEKYRDVIEIKESMFEGIEYIIEHKGEFDCVILDVNMGSNESDNDNVQFNMDEKTNEGKIWRRFLNHVNLDIEPEPEGNKIDYKIGNESAVSALGRNAGFYLVLFLISLGFPKERIIMFTAYGDGARSSTDNLVSKWKETFKTASLYIPCVIDKDETFNMGGKDKNKELNKKINELYSDDYYKTRLFLCIIYNAFILYKKQIKKSENVKKEDKTIFNYVCKDTDKKIQIDQVEDLIRDILFYFPYIKHDYVKDVNYQALKRFSEPFEAEYIPNRIGEHNTYRVMKLYRNWCAHGLFSNPEKLSDAMFRLLLVVGLLLMIEPKRDNVTQIEENKRNLIKLSQEWKKDLWEKIKFLVYIEDNTESAKILKHMEEYDWNICKNWNEIPKNMIDVYDRYGKKGKKQMKFDYLLDAFMNCYISKEIQYEGNTCRTKYELSEQIKEGMYLDLFKSAYAIFDELQKIAVAENFLMRYYGISQEDFVVFDLSEASEAGERVVSIDLTEAIEQVRAYYADGMTEAMLNKFFADRLATRVQEICVAEGVNKAVFKSVELEAVGSAEEGAENYNYSCTFAVGEKEYNATGQISLVDDNGVMKVSNLHPMELIEAKAE